MIRRTCLALLLGLGVSHASAFAQFQPLTPYPNAYNTPLYGNFNVNPVFGGNSGFLLSGVLPLSNGIGTKFTTGPNGVMYPSSFSLQSKMAPPLYSPGKHSNFGGGYLGVPESANQAVLDRQKRDIAAAQAQASYQAMTGEAQKNVAKWVAEKGNEAAVDPLTAVEADLIHPSEEAMVSGATLNELAARIVALDAQGKRAKSGLCPPELLEKIVFVGGPPADILNLFRRASKPNVPDLVPDSITLEPLTQAYAPVAAALFSGKRALPADAQKLADANSVLRTAVEPAMGRASIADAGRMLAFFNALERAARFSSEAEAAGVLTSKWASVGSNVPDLVRQMAKLKVRFGRAAAGDELVYATLHRAMLAHYAAAAVAK